MKPLKCMILVAIILFVFTACSNQTFDNAIEKGLENLVEKNYPTAVSYFEIALEEEKDSQEAKSYLEQANLLNDAHNSMIDEDYDNALRSVLKIEKLDEALSMVKTNASDLKEELSKKQQNLVYEEELKGISSLIDDGNYEAAKSKLETLKNVLGSNSDFTSHLDELTQLLNESKADYVSQIKESQQNQQVVDEDSNSEDQTVLEQDQKETFEYQTYTNTRFGFSVEHPTTFTAGPAPTNNDGREFYNEDCTIITYGSHINTIEENETIENYYNRALGNAPGSIAYQRLGSDSYTISYTNGSNIVYEKSIINDGVIFTLNMTYPSSQQNKYDEMVTRVADTFTAGGMD